MGLTVVWAGTSLQLCLRTEPLLSSTGGEQQHCLVPRLHAQLDQPDPSWKYADPPTHTATGFYGSPGLLHGHRLALPGISFVSVFSIQDKGPL